VKCHHRRTFVEVPLPRTFAELSFPVYFQRNVTTAHLYGGVTTGVLSVKCHYRRTFSEKSPPRTFAEVSLPAYFQRKVTTAHLCGGVNTGAPSVQKALDLDEVVLKECVDNGSGVLEGNVAGRRGCC